MVENTYEYIIKEKAEGKTLAKRLLLGLGYLLFTAVSLILTVTFVPPELFFGVTLIVLALTALLILLTWRFVCVEYEVIISAGEISITVIYGKRIRKKRLVLDIQSFAEIGIYDDAAYEEISKLSLQRNLICLSSLSAPDVYYALYEDDKDYCILYFDAPPRAIELLKKCNSAAFRASATRIGSRANTEIKKGSTT